MDIQEEKEAFLNVYVNYKSDSRKISFNEETEQFMWRKNNVSDTEVEYVHFMNQQWYAWLACAKSKAQAVPAKLILELEKGRFKEYEFKALLCKSLRASKVTKSKFNWVHVMSMLGTGSTAAHRICEALGVNPDGTEFKAQEPANEL